MFTTPHDSHEFTFQDADVPSVELGELYLVPVFGVGIGHELTDERMRQATHYYANFTYWKERTKSTDYHIACKLHILFIWVFWSTSNTLVESDVCNHVSSHIGAFQPVLVRHSSGKSKFKDGGTATSGDWLKRSCDLI